MQDQYFLSTLICFFRSQLDYNFIAIRNVLEIVDDEETDDDNKRDLIMETLRFYGLNETCYRSGRFSFASNRTDEELINDEIHLTVKYPLQSISFPVLNGTITVRIPLN